MDVPRAARLQVRVAAAVSLVRPVLLVSFIQFGEHPLRIGLGQEADQIDLVRAVAEQHGPGAAEVEGDALQFADGSLSRLFPDLAKDRPPAARVVHIHHYLVAFHRLDHPVRVRQASGDRLLAEEAPHSGLGRVHHDIRVLVVRGHHAQQFRLLLGDHLAVVGVPLHPGEYRRPVVHALVHPLLDQVTDADHFGLGEKGISAQVGVRHLRAETSLALHRPPTGGDPCQAHHTGTVLSVARHVSSFPVPRNRSCGVSTPAESTLREVH